ncbi:DUF72 domain-containing protein [Xylophilus sp.]|uniref:DUF72 domain-containing protein n=1 Tax=Xylophilus sp. TaxID=2653893 RepID=UPI0013BD3DD4|nr:DUF72 domain-containing protein [Xylophilus sp.]KAF1047285.1 MAG: hypothetical protein GAK38_01997 [Xylophilus sp.]
MQQPGLFADDEPAPGLGGGPVEPAAPPAAPRRRAALAAVEPLPPDAALEALAAALPPTLRLGTSSWSYPGWDGLVWKGPHSESLLARKGLAAYARHPLLRTVSLDRAFYRPLTATQYAGLAAQVPEDFRFVVKAPNLVTEATVRDDNGRPTRENAAFLDPALAVSEVARPLIEGLGAQLGVLVFQLSPLPFAWLGDLPRFLDRLHALLHALPDLREAAPGAIVAVEVRNPELLREPGLPDVLRATGATYCLGLHARLPPIEEQLGLLRRLWPGPLVCRWNLHRRHGRQGYANAEKLYAPFDRIHDPDDATRDVLARTIAGFASRGQPVFVTVSNTAEGSAPLSLRALAEAVREHR